MFKIDLYKNNSTYYLLKDRYDSYYLGSFIDYKKNINRRFNLKDNIEKVICEKCHYRKYSNARITSFYLTLTKNIIDIFKKDLDSIIKNNKLTKKFIYKEDAIKKLITLDNKNYYLIYYLDEYTYLCNYNKDIKEDSILEGIDISDINIKGNLDSITFTYFLYLMKDFYSTLLDKLKFFELSENDILFNSLDINLEKNKLDKLDNLFYELSNIYLYNIFINLESIVKEKIEINFLNNKFYFKYNNNNNFYLLTLLNDSLAKIIKFINFEGEFKVPFLREESNFCSLYLRQKFLSSFSENCKLGRDIINNNFQIFTMLDNNYLSNIVKKSFFVKDNKFYYKNNLFPLEIDCQIGFFYRLDSPFYRKNFYILTKKNSCISVESFGNISNEGFCCTGDLSITLYKIFYNLKYCLDIYFNSIFTLEYNQLILIRPSLYLNYDLNIISINKPSDCFSSFEIVTIINPSNSFLSSFCFFNDDNEKISKFSLCYSDGSSQVFFTPFTS